MVDLYRAPTTQKAAKQHKCIACLGPIPLGENYVQQTGFHEGSSFRNKYHKECWDSLSEDGEFEFMPGELDWPERIAALMESTQ